MAHLADMSSITTIKYCSHWKRSSTKPGMRSPFTGAAFAGQHVTKLDAHMLRPANDDPRLPNHLGLVTPTAPPICWRLTVPRCEFGSRGRFSPFEVLTQGKTKCTRTLIGCEGGLS